MNDEASTLTRLYHLVADVFMIDPVNLTPSSTANDVPGWDSVSQVMLIMRIEDSFDVSIDAGAASEAADLQALAALIESSNAHI